MCRTRKREWQGSHGFAALAVSVVMLAMPALSFAHPERPSYWPDPAPDPAVSPPAGGKVPNARPLDTAVSGQGPGEVRVVCVGNQGKQSLANLEQSLRRAHTEGYRPRPSRPKVFWGPGRAGWLRNVNQALAKKCRYHEVQPAINHSGNNDRVVIMPGLYTEPTSRQAPTNDPRCKPGLLQTQANGGTAPSFEYQATCPNDQNLIYVQGRRIKGDPTDPPLDNRQGIPARSWARACDATSRSRARAPGPRM